MVIHLGRYRRRGQCFAGALDLAQNLFTFGLPDVALRMQVAFGKVGKDGVGQFLYGGEAAGGDAVGQIAEEPLNQIEPRRRGWREVHMEAGMLRQPGFHLGVLVGRVVVGDQVNREILGRFPVDLPQEGQPFLMPVLLGDGRDQFAFQIVQRGKQGQGAVAKVIVGGGLDMADAQWQARLSTFQRLALRLLVAAQHQRFLRRVEIQTDDVPEFLLEARVVRQLEGSGQVRLDVVGGPQTLHAGRRDTRRLRHGAATPASLRRRRSRYRLQRLPDRRLGQRRFAPTARRVCQPGQPVLGKAPAPVIHGYARDADSFSYGLLRAPLGRQQNDLRTLPIPHLYRAGAHAPVQFPSLFRFQRDPLSRHDTLPKAPRASSIGEFDKM